MNVLIVDEEVPYPPNTGKRLRTYNIVKRLQKRHQITYLCYGNGGEFPPDCPNVRFVTLQSPIIAQSGVPFYGALLKNLLSRYPYVVDRHYSEIMSRRATSLTGKDRFDLVHCEWTPYTENILPLLHGMPSVLSAHNVEAQIWERYFLSEQNPLKKAYIHIQWRKLLKYEKLACKRYSEVTAVSVEDKGIFQRDYGCKNITVVSNGVDNEYFAPMDSPPNRHGMVFTGSMDWRPNQDGIHYFLKDIYPLIKQRLPHATVTVVGRKPPQWLVDLADAIPGVIVTGTVDDVRPFIAENALYIVPLRIGGGSRLKILEAFSMEKPVLSTSIGAEGLEVEDGSHLLLRDGPESFAQAAIDMLSNPQRYETLGKSGRELILDKYTWDSIATVMDGVWQRAAGRCNG